MAQCNLFKGEEALLLFTLRAAMQTRCHILNMELKKAFHVGIPS